MRRRQGIFRGCCFSLAVGELERDQPDSYSSKINTTYDNLWRLYGQLYELKIQTWIKNGHGSCRVSFDCDVFIWVLSRRCRFLKWTWTELLSSSSFSCVLLWSIGLHLFGKPPWLLLEPVIISLIDSMSQVYMNKSWDCYLSLVFWILFFFFSEDFPTFTYSLRPAIQE